MNHVIEVPPKVAVWHHHPLLGRGIASRLEPTFQVVCVADIRDIASHRPALLVYPVSEPLERLEAVRHQLPELRIVLAADPGRFPAPAPDSLPEGVHGCARLETPQELVRCCQAVNNGETYLPRPAHLVLLHSVQQLLRCRQLSPREMDVLQALVWKVRQPEMARRLDISLSTLKGHLTRVYRKLGVRGHAQALEISHELERLTSRGRAAR